MALIKCSECGKEISDKAAGCPNCGCPMPEILAAIERERRSAIDYEIDGDTSKVKACMNCGAIYWSTDAVGYPAGQEWVLDMVNNILVEVLASIAQQERETIRQRQAEGIAAAKGKGKHLGRPKAVKSANWDEVIAQWRRGEITAVEAMRRTGTKRSTFYKLNN